LSHKLEVGERRSLVSHYTLTTEDFSEHRESRETSFLYQCAFQC